MSKTTIMYSNSVPTALSSLAEFKHEWRKRSGKSDRNSMNSFPWCIRVNYTVFHWTSFLNTVSALCSNFGKAHSCWSMSMLSFSALKFWKQTINTLHVSQTSSCIHVYMNRVLGQNDMEWKHLRIFHIFWQIHVNSFKLKSISHALGCSWKRNDSIKETRVAKANG